MLTALTREFALVHSMLFEELVEPTLYALHLGRYAEAAYDATEFFLLGLLQILLLYLLLRPLEAWRPAERWENRRAVRSDIGYTYLHRLGIIPLAIYALLTPLVDEMESWLRLWGFIPPKLEDVFPWLLSYPFVSFIGYLVIIDFCDYWRHRFQHRSPSWWALHSLHHSQRQLSLWADDRNHLLDDVLSGLWSTGLAWLIGVPPGQFIAWVMVTRMVESLSHANIRVPFGAIGERLVVSPRFHRVHHAMEIGHDGPQRGCNFATLLPVWDIMFGTANFTTQYVTTGVTDQLSGRDYGETFWRQQWLGCKRLQACWQNHASE